jgi:hypothetical protein
MLWHSDDMVNWEFHHLEEPFDPGYAPTVVVHGECLYLSASWDGSSIWRARNPLGPWEKLGTHGEDEDGNATWLKDENGQPVRWGDPCLFVDDDGALYCYCNLAEATPAGDEHPYKLKPCEGVIYGVRLRADDPSRFAGAPVALIEFSPSRWWERYGEHNQMTAHPVLEGAWMTKHDGRYYLQYSSNGTEFKNYAVGCFTGNSPLGPFTAQQRNPILIQRHGFVNGTAHHSVVDGPDGRLWCFYTVRINNVHPMERRIGMDLVLFDENGEMYVDGPSSAPQFAPGQPRSGDAGLLPLSVNMNVNATSVRDGRDARYAVDDSIQTWWQAADSKQAQSITVDLAEKFDVTAARIVFADQGLDYAAGIVPGPYRYRVWVSLDNKAWHIAIDRSSNTEERHIAYETCAPVKAQYARLEVLAAPSGMEIAVAEFTVFGKPNFSV